MHACTYVRIRLCVHCTASYGCCTRITKIIYYIVKTKYRVKQTIYSKDACMYVHFIQYVCMACVHACVMCILYVRVHACFCVCVCVHVFMSMQIGMHNYA